MSQSGCSAPTPPPTPGGDSCLLPSPPRSPRLGLGWPVPSGRGVSHFTTRSGAHLPPDVFLSVLSVGGRVLIRLFAF